MQSGLSQSVCLVVLAHFSVDLPLLFFFSCCEAVLLCVHPPLVPFVSVPCAVCCTLCVYSVSGSVPIFTLFFSTSNSIITQSSPAGKGNCMYMVSKNSLFTLHLTLTWPTSRNQLTLSAGKCSECVDCT